MPLDNLSEINYLFSIDGDHYYELPLGGQFARYFCINTSEITEIGVMEILRLEEQAKNGVK